MPPSILNLFLSGDRVTGACSGSVTGWPGISVCKFFWLVLTNNDYNKEKLLFDLNGWPLKGPVGRIKLLDWHAVVASAVCHQLTSCYEAHNIYMEI